MDRTSISRLAKAFVSLQLVGSLTLVGSAVAQPRTPVGLSASGAELLFQSGVAPHDPAAHDRFGSAVAVGDFDGDGFDDLAIGTPSNDCGAEVPDCGAVEVRVGWTFRALSPSILISPAENPRDIAEAGDLYGYALAAGDMNGDGRDDLAVGVPANWVDAAGGRERAGSVQLHFGLPTGEGRIQLVAEHSFSQAVGSGLPGGASRDENFGGSVAFGDFDGDGKEELVVGISHDKVMSGAEEIPAGAVMVIGLNAAGVPEGTLLRPGLGGLPGVPARNDRFGEGVATGDFDGDGFDDLAIGAPGHDSGAGTVLVVYGSASSLQFSEHQLLSGTDFGDASEADDEFGRKLVAGDFNNDGYDDLAVGAPLEDENPIVNSGIVLVAYGSGARLSMVGTSRLTEDWVAGSGSEPFDWFGGALAVGDYDADGYDDLAIGAPGESSEAGLGAGATTVVRGGPLGLTGRPSRLLEPHRYPAGLIAQVDGQSDEFAGFGFALASGDFDGNGQDDLAIGAPWRSLGPAEDVGTVGVVFGQLFLDGFEAQDGFEWSTTLGGGPTIP